ncbi:MAG TPA: hypothetical protein PLF40_27105, partial [Kofleriaceae bacterium]|nr:hypothetical protein [Kofleriaceae bacterium]
MRTTMTSDNDTKAKVARLNLSPNKARATLPPTPASSVSSASIDTRIADDALAPAPKPRATLPPTHVAKTPAAQLDTLIADHD